MKLATRLVRFQPAPGDAYSAMSPPLYQTATFAQASALESGPYDYSRSGNPTRRLLEQRVAELEGAGHALAYASGLAALAAVVRVAAGGGEVLAGDDLYGGTYRLLSQQLAGQGVAVRYVDAADLAAVAAAIGPRTRLLLVETPTNPLLRIADLRGLAGLAHAAGALLAVDNSLLSPYLQRPLELGADVVVHSATKCLGGHSDLTAGVVAVTDPALARELAFAQNAEGTALSPFEAWLLQRGMKTLAVRLDRQESNARRVAELLAGHPRVRRVHYPGLPSHPGHQLQGRQASGAGSVVSFETGSVEVSRQIVEATRLFTISVSFGGVGSLISLPCRMSHASIPASVRRSRALPEDLVRLAVGIEHAGDLLEDLEQALGAGE
ncbi:MAG TPA: cystathionine beta-lyase [Thermoanaerobaculia bacterium]|jgi:cystathionine beta-lyase|nr:cystathionine beta-lyase [Thermoanaerobaculia bacterium]